MKNWIPWSLRQRIVLIAAVPALLATLLLTGFYTYQQRQEHQESMEQFVHTLLEELVVAAEYPIISGNYDMLEPLLSTVLRQATIVSIQVVDMQQQEIIVLYTESYDEVNPEDIHYYDYRVMHNVKVMDEFSQFEDDLGTGQKQQLATIYLGTANTFIRHLEALMVWKSVLAGLLVAVLAALFGRIIASDLITSLERLSEYFSYLGKGKMEQRLIVDGATEMAELQTNANRLADSLQQAERDRARHTRELMVEQDKTRKASQAKSQFLAMMSHELRTPLNGAIGTLQLMDQQLPESEYRDYKFMAEQSLEHLTQLLEDVLIVVDIENNKLQVTWADNYIQQVLKQLVQHFTEIAMNRGVSFVIDYGPRTRQSICIAPSLVRQVVRHLVDNAFKYTEQGVVTLTVDLEHVEQRTCLIIRVTDTGIGIDDDQKQEVLEAFSRGDTSFSRRYEGMGLGLTISHHVSQILNGHLLLEDNPRGSGTQVKVVLPIQAVT